MCLDKLKDFKVKQSVGYKVFTKDSNGILYSRFQKSHYLLYINKWITAEQTTRYTDMLESYLTGFHIFLRKADAIRWHGYNPNISIIKKVKFKNIIAKGVERDMEIVVVNKMLILPNQR